MHHQIKIIFLTLVVSIDDSLCGNCAGTDGNSELLRAKEEEGKPQFYWHL